MPANERRGRFAYAFDLIVLVVFAAAIVLAARGFDRAAAASNAANGAAQALVLFATALLVVCGLLLVILVRLFRELVALRSEVARALAKLGEHTESLAEIHSRLADVGMEWGAGRIALAAAPNDAAHASSGASRLDQLQTLLRRQAYVEARGLFDDWIENGKELPGDEQALLRVEWIEQTKKAKSELRALLQASRGANDPEAVLTLCEQLFPLLIGTERTEFEGEQVKWFLQLLMRRMRAGLVRLDVVELAERVASTFPTTAEGASLRASLPTLRRSVGMCPRCGKPYAGIENSCPACAESSRQPTPQGPENNATDVSTVQPNLAGPL